MSAQTQSRRIGVLGAGVMGGGIAQVCATGGYDVVCYDIAPDALDRGPRARDDRPVRPRVGRRAREADARGGRRRDRRA